MHDSFYLRRIGVRKCKRQSDDTTPAVAVRVGNSEVHGTHPVMWARGLIWCSRCGCYASVLADSKSSCKHFQKPCRPPTKAGNDYLRRLFDDLMPKVEYTTWPDGTLVRAQRRSRRS